MKKFLAIAMIAATLTSCGGDDASKEGAMTHEDSVSKGLIKEEVKTEVKKTEEKKAEKK